MSICTNFESRSKILTLGKTQNNLWFFARFALTLQAESTVTVCRWCHIRHERKVRAAQGAPLLKVEAIGDSRSGQKKTTAAR